MLHVFNAIERHFQKHRELERVCGPVFLLEGEGADTPHQTPNCVIVTNNGMERLDLDSATVDQYDLTLSLTTRVESGHVPSGVLEGVELLKQYFHNQTLESPWFNTVEMIITSSPQPRVEDAVCVADVGLSLTVCLRDEPALLRYV